MDSHTSILSCTILPIRSQNIPVGSSTPWRTPALHSCHSHLCGSSACHAVPCFGRSLLKPISCFMLKKQCSKEVSTGGCSIYGCSFSICLTLNLLSHVFLFLLLPSSSSTPAFNQSPLPRLSSYPLCCFYHKPTNVIFQVKLPSLRHLSKWIKKIQVASPALQGREPAWPWGGCGGCCWPLELLRSWGFTLPSSWSLVFSFISESAPWFFF